MTYRIYKHLPEPRLARHQRASIRQREQAQPLLLAHGRTDPLLQNRPRRAVPEVRVGRGIRANADGVIRQLAGPFQLRDLGACGFLQNAL